MIASQGRGRGYYWRHGGPAICAIVLGGLLAGCTASSPSGAQEAAHTGHGASAPAGQGGADPAHAGDQQHQAQPAGAPSAEDAALQLQALLGHHSIVASEMMRARIRGDEDFAQSANAALGKNTDAMVEMVKALLGESAASQFKTMWTGHVTALFDYARGLATPDLGVRKEAQSTLGRFEADLAEFFAAGSQGRLPVDAANAAVQAHIHHLLQQADAYAAGDYTKANQLFREAYSHTFELGKILAVALLGPEKTAGLETPAWRLRSELTRLLGEHVVLAVAATRAGVLNAPDFAAAAEVVNANTADLAGAIEVLFGAEAAKSFMALWADHLQQVMAYTAAVVAKDTARRDEAVAKLGRFEGQFAAFLGTAAGGQIPAAELAQALAMHDEKLIQQIDAFASKDYQTAHDSAYSTYEHMRELATQLADAFGDAVAARLPTGGPETGLGGMAEQVGRR
jgi:hypothetical protein